MSNKILYPLIGDNTEKVEWVVTTKLRPDLSFPIEGQNSFLSATHYPLLQKEQIPLKWLKKDPGFPILLIDPNDIQLDWIYHPYDMNKNHYQLRQSPPKKTDRFLIVLEEDATIEDIKLIEGQFKGDKKFIYRIRDNFEMMKKLTENSFPFQILNSYFFCFQSHWRPDLIVFQKPEFSKCIRPHIIHSIHLGGVIQTKYINETPSLKNVMWYGTWELFHARG